jgi:hypothetical protein
MGPGQGHLCAGAARLPVGETGRTGPEVGLRGLQVVGELEREISTEGSRPVLPDKEFHDRLAEFQRALELAPAAIP